MLIIPPLRRVFPLVAAARKVSKQAGASRALPVLIIGSASIHSVLRHGRTQRSLSIKSFVSKSTPAKPSRLVLVFVKRARQRLMVPMAGRLDPLNGLV